MKPLRESLARRVASRPGRWSRLHLALGVLAVAAVLGRADAPQSRTAAQPARAPEKALRIVDIPVRFRSHVLGRPAVENLLIAPDRRSVAFELHLIPRNQLRNPETRYHVCDVEKGILREPFSSEKAIIRSGLFSPTGVAVTCPRGPFRSLALWDVKTGRELRRLDAPTRCDLLGFSPDGKYVAGIGSEGKVYLWETASGKARRPFGDGPGRVDCFAFSSDGEVIVTQNEEDLTRGSREPSEGPRMRVSTHLWETTTGKRLARLSEEILSGEAYPAIEPFRVLGAKEPGFRVFRSPAGAYLLVPPVRVSRLTVSVNREADVIAVTNAVSGEEVFRHRPADCRVERADLSADGRLLFAFLKGWEADGRFYGFRVLAWDLSRLAQKADTRLSREQMVRAWSLLRSEDPYEARDAMSLLVLSPGQTIDWVRERVRRVPRRDAAYLAGLVAKLDATSFRTRRAAREELDVLGEQAVAVLRKVVREPSVSEHARKEMREILSDLEGLASPSPHRLRQLRALALLAQLQNDNKARQLLGDLAKGAPGVWLTEQAATVLRSTSPRQ
jgi:hypothetical protein